MKNWLLEQEIHAPKEYIQEALKTVVPYSKKNDQWEKVKENQWHWSYKGLIKEGMVTIEINEKDNTTCDIKANIVCNPTYRFLMDKKQHSWIEHCLKTVWFEGVKHHAQRQYKRKKLEKKNKNLIMIYENVWKLNQLSLQRLCNEIVENEWFAILAKDDSSLLSNYKTLMAEGRCVLINEVMDEMKSPTHEEVQKVKKELASLATKLARWEEI